MTMLLTITELFIATSQPEFLPTGEGGKTMESHKCKTTTDCHSSTQYHIQLIQKALNLLKTNHPTMGDICLSEYQSKIECFIIRRPTIPTRVVCLPTLESVMPVAGGVE